MTCSYDYLKEDWNHKTYIIYAFVLNYMLPLVIVMFFYSQIVKAVITHEASLKAQAKKMNVESLRSNIVSRKNKSHKISLKTRTNFLSKGFQGWECRNQNCQGGHYQCHPLGWNLVILEKCPEQKSVPQLLASVQQYTYFAKKLDCRRISNDVNL